MRRQGARIGCIGERPTEDETRRLYGRSGRLFLGRLKAGAGRLKTLLLETDDASAVLKSCEQVLHSRKKSAGMDSKTGSGQNRGNPTRNGQINGDV